MATWALVFSWLLPWATGRETWSEGAGGSGAGRAGAFPATVAFEGMPLSPRKARRQKGI